MNYNHQKNNSKLIIKKGIKYYLKGKNLLNENKEISNLYFKKSLDCFQQLDDKKKNKYKDFINETETECNNFIKITNKNIFDLIDEGSIDQIKKLKLNEFDIVKDGLTPAHHCIKAGDLNCLKVLLKKGISIDTINKNGHTLLDYACLEKDPNAIEFLMNHGADMEKHLFFRKDIKLILNKSDIDLAIIMKLILLNYDENIEIEKTKFLFNYIQKDENIQIKFYNQDNPKELKFEHLIKGLETVLLGFSESKSETYIQILKEELEYDLKNKLGCPDKKLDIILINLVPFIEYPFKISSRFILSLEIKYLLKKLLRKNYSDNIELKKKLLNEVWKSYINTNIVKEDYIGIITNQWISKINL